MAALCIRRGEMEADSITFRHSIGLALTDTLDDLISEERINPQLAMKILGNFDQAITEVLQKNVKSRLQFKARGPISFFEERVLKRRRREAHS